MGVVADPMSLAVCRADDAGWLCWLRHPTRLLTRTDCALRPAQRPRYARQNDGNALGPSQRKSPLCGDEDDATTPHSSRVAAVVPIQSLSTLLCGIEGDQERDALQLRPRVCPPQAQTGRDEVQSWRVEALRAKSRRKRSCAGDAADQRLESKRCPAVAPCSLG